MALVAAVHFCDAAQPPVVTMAGFSSYSATNVTLGGNVNPGGTTAKAWFEWGPGNTFREFTAPTNLASGSSPVAVSAQIAGLTGGCAYQARLVASNSLGVVRTRPVSFAVPLVALNGSNPLTNAQFDPFVDPGATASGPFLALSAGDHHSLVLRANGTVVGWGGNDETQTSIPATVTNLIAVSAGFGHNLALRADGGVIAWGSNILNRTVVPASATNGVVAVAAGDFHSLALKSNGTVVAWGANLDLQCNVPAAATNVVAIAAGYAFSLALRGDGTVVGWGNDDYGQVSEPMAEANNMVAIAASLSHVLGLKADGTVDFRSRKLIHDWKSTRGPDGMKLDAAGRLYVAAGLNKPQPPFETADPPTAGIYVFSPEGKMLTFVPIPRDETTNRAFGGDDLKTLYVTAGGSLWSMRTTTAGRPAWPSLAK